PDEINDLRCRSEGVGRKEAPMKVIADRCTLVEIDGRRLVAGEPAVVEVMEESRGRAAAVRVDRRSVRRSEEARPVDVIPGAILRVGDVDRMRCGAAVCAEKLYVAGCHPFDHV